MNLHYKTRNSGEGATASLGDDGDISNMSCTDNEKLCWALGNVSLEDLICVDDRVQVCAKHCAARYYPRILFDLAASLSELCATLVHATLVQEVPNCSTNGINSNRAEAVHCNPR